MLTTRKRSDQSTLVSPAAATVVEDFMGAIGGRGIYPAQAPPGHRDDAAHTLRPSTRFIPRSLGNKRQMRATCSALSPNNWAITHLFLLLSWGALPAERIIPHIMSPDPGNASIRSPFLQITHVPACFKFCRITMQMFSRKVVRCSVVASLQDGPEHLYALSPTKWQML